MTEFRRFTPYVAKVRHLYALGFIGSLFRFLIPLSVPLVVKYMFDQLLQNEAMPAAARVQQLLYIAGAMLVVFVLVRGPMEYIRQYFMHKANNHIIKALRTDAFRKVHTLDSRYLADHKSGEIGGRFFDDIERIRGYLTAVFSNVWIELIVLGFVVTVMLTLNIKLTLLAVVFVALQFALAHVLSRRLKQTTHSMMSYRSVLSGFIFEKIQGAFVSKLFAAEKRDREELGRHLDRYEQLTDRQADVQALSLATVNMLSDLTPFIVVLAGSWFVMDGSLTLGSLMAFFAYVDRMRSPVTALVQAYPAITEGNVALRRVFDFLDTPSSIQEAAQPVELTEFRHSVQFRQVGFSYADGREVLRDMSFTLEKGKTYAFVGGSGGGKSTVLQLLTRMYDADRGEVLVDGVNIQEVALSSLRKLTGIVTQDNFLYSSSIGDNIRIGRPGATDEEVRTAAMLAHAHEFIEALPRGYDTEVGERGVKLSGGQKQRIALARVFLKNPPILLLDEATSALDNESEKLVQEAITAFGSGKTVVMIAHRLSTVVDADTIFVVQDGRIVESGSHAELLARGGYYKELYEKQHPYGDAGMPADDLLPSVAAEGW
ncbi:ABC transporter ATP-binding protein [Paenibacillus chartarius]|uniref:ABC transporter ATP-binding protein n=1 Tax=Paenibacillus chartarius TaxID=747481 RepID=A0ABV6DGN7_9BACL